MFLFITQGWTFRLHKEQKYPHKLLHSLEFPMLSYNLCHIWTQIMNITCQIVSSADIQCNEVASNGPMRLSSPSHCYWASTWINPSDFRMNHWWSNILTWTPGVLSQTSYIETRSYITAKWLLRQCLCLTSTELVLDGSDSNKKSNTGELLKSKNFGVEMQHYSEIITVGPKFLLVLPPPPPISKWFNSPDPPTFLCNSVIVTWIKMLSTRWYNTFSQLSSWKTSHR